MKYAIVAVSGLAIAANAHAAISFTQVGTALLSGGSTAVIFSGFGTGTATSFIYHFGYSEPIGDSSWASDMQITLTAPNLNSVSIAGFDNLGGLQPSYDGPGSNAPGVYGSNFDISSFNLAGAGTWTVTITNDWGQDPNPNLIGGAIGSALAEELNPFMGTIEGVNVPAPGAAAIFGLAGLIAVRRKRETS